MRVSQLTYNAEVDRYEMDGQCLSCGDCIDVLVWNGITDREEWVSTRIEQNVDGWYLVGIVGYQMNGLFARI